MINGWRLTAQFNKKGTGSKGMYIRYSKWGKGDIIISEQDGTFLVTFESFNKSKRFKNKTIALKKAKEYMRKH